MTGPGAPWGLHVIPDSLFEARHGFLGSTKDVRGRTEYFHARGIPVIEIAPEARSDADLLRRLKTMDLRNCRFALFEYTYYPRSLQWLRAVAPHILRITRPHNAEFLHRVHRLLATVKTRRLLTTSAAAREILGVMLDARRALALDIRSARASNVVVAITEWEARRYWRTLAGKTQVKTLPYFLPTEYLTERPPEGDKQLQCVCYLSPTLNPFLLDAARNFLLAVEQLGDARRNWSFATTGELPAALGSPPSRIRPLGFLENPLPVLAASKAIAILSDYGFGFKTKLLEAIQQRCYSLVTPSVFARLPASVRPYCVQVRPSSARSFEQALARCEAPFPFGDPNEVLRDEAYETLDKLLSPLFLQSFGARRSNANTTP